MKSQNDINTSDLKVVVGLGKTGLSCVRYLAKINCNIAVIDSRISPPYLKEMQDNFPKIVLALGGFDNDLLLKANELIVSPGISLKEPAIAAQIKRGVSAIGDIELFARRVTAPIVAITGSNGKSTVTTLVGEMAKTAGLDVRVGGNLGNAALDLITDQKPDLYVLELSSFQLETTYSLRPAAAVVLNITTDHMDRYANFAEYQHAKLSIYRYAKISLVNRDERKIYANHAFAEKILSFGTNRAKHGEFGFSDGFLTFGKKKLIASSELKIKGHHQIANALAALALGYAVNLPFDVMIAALRNFAGLKHRCQWIRKIDGSDWYNDSKGTNIGAAQAAIAGLGCEIKGKIVLIAGGRGKNADFAELRQVVKNYVRTLILIGEDAKIIATTLRGSCQIVFAQSMLDAVYKAREMAKVGDAVLLSPACASYDMFENFECRGTVFVDLVRSLS